MKEKEFWDMANNWYQRTHRLREFAKDQSKPYEKRQKAFNLFLNMVNRMLKITKVASSISKEKSSRFAKEAKTHRGGCRFSDGER